MAEAFQMEAPVDKQVGQMVTEGHMVAARLARRLSHVEEYLTLGFRNRERQNVRRIRLFPMLPIHSLCQCICADDE
ncbi:hypothetical protein A3H16_01270 [Candidatus Kaiserbacteria bacterium RIFCSPLOWO2_12_FULL_53_8]|uniref:Uncharacterized protein n=2 Tax=Candidatus Kaiseribacteriota TaxID=1752734 RepID=A0A1F6CVI4_9BACT|nr:MAG: hypothetical protein A2851_03740 [Candidatus Kaiserbacteria bacterium RIFCSPHIGHO2_01_FULL_53_29]OGG92328.1 MAG: hypothetical protein A3H16_01270 [Candidatus Kaiserbacteria bacterium RIFCSPLOWO2_12_FULL_53_8]